MVFNLEINSSKNGLDKGVKMTPDQKVIIYLATAA